MPSTFCVATFFKFFLLVEFYELITVTIFRINGIFVPATTSFSTRYHFIVSGRTPPSDSAFKVSQKKFCNKNFPHSTHLSIRICKKKLLSPLFFATFEMFGYKFYFTKTVKDFSHVR